MIILLNSVLNHRFYSSGLVMTYNVDILISCSCFALSVGTNQGFQENHTFSFSTHYSNGITTAIYHPGHRWDPHLGAIFVVYVCVTVRGMFFSKSEHKIIWQSLDHTFVICVIPTIHVWTKILSGLCLGSAYWFFLKKVFRILAATWGQSLYIVCRCVCTFVCMCCSHV